MSICFFLQNTGHRDVHLHMECPKIIYISHKWDTYIENKVLYTFYMYILYILECKVQVIEYGDSYMWGMRVTQSTVCKADEGSLRREAKDSTRMAVRAAA